MLAAAASPAEQADVAGLSGASLSGKVDILLALTGEHSTIALADLDDAIQVIRTRMVIPMHHWHERGVLKFEPVDRFVERFPPAQVKRIQSSEIGVSSETLPAPGAPPRIVVLEQARSSRGRAASPAGELSPQQAILVLPLSMGPLVGEVEGLRRRATPGPASRIAASRPETSSPASGRFG